MQNVTFFYFEKHLKLLQQWRSGIKCMTEKLRTKYGKQWKTKQKQRNSWNKSKADCCIQYSAPLKPVLRFIFKSSWFFGNVKLITMWRRKWFCATLAVLLCTIYPKNSISSYTIFCAKFYFTSVRSFLINWNWILIPKMIFYS